MNQNLRVSKTYFHIKGFALGIALKQRRKAAQKSPIAIFKSWSSPCWEKLSRTCLSNTCFGFLHFLRPATGKTGPLPHYGSFISRIFLEYLHTTDNIFHTMELDKTMEIGFSNLSLQYSQNISIP